MVMSNDEVEQIRTFCSSLQKQNVSRLVDANMHYGVEYHIDQQKAAMQENDSQHIVIHTKRQKEYFIADEKVQLHTITYAYSSLLKQLVSESVTGMLHNMGNLRYSQIERINDY